MGPGYDQTDESILENHNGPSDLEDNVSIAHNEKKPIGLSFTPFILMMALSVHSIFEGIAVGLADS